MGVDEGLQCSGDGFGPGGVGVLFGGVGEVAQQVGHAQLVGHRVRVLNDAVPDDVAVVERRWP